MMSVFRMIAVGVALSLSGLSAPVLAQDFTEETTRSDITINDISGHWIIEVIDRPDHDFKGTAFIPSADGRSVAAETVTEDKCCSGQNHARVLQDSQITIDKDGNISVTSSIVKYLLRKEGLPLTYHPDDFELRQLDSNTLIGTANGYLPIRWIRERVNVS